jgi:hypothetical protein
VKGTEKREGTGQGHTVRQQNRMRAGFSGPQLVSVHAGLNAGNQPVHIAQ